MKTRILLLFSFALCQSHRVSFDLNQPYEKKHSFVRFQNLYISKENRFLFSNYNKNYSIKNWFYSMGPYNDTWGSDILKVHNSEGKRPISYYPFGNSILSFQSQHQNRYSDKNASVYLNILGFNLKKLQASNVKHHFYGSE